MTRKMFAAGTYAAAALSIAVAPKSFGQAAPAAPAAPTPGEEEIVVLSPFEVTASDSSTGYSVKDTLAGTRIRTDLRDVASSLAVVNKQLMSDIGATDSRSLLQYTSNTEVGGVGGNFLGGSYPSSSDSYGENAGLLRPNSNTRVRGLDAADNTRDFFLSDIPWDSYIVDRVDIQRGPNSILFGVGSPAGIINSSLNTASFANAYSYENKVDRWGSLRNSLDANQVLIDGTLAVRVAVLDDRKKFEQKPAFEDVHRYYGAINFQPKLLDRAHTQVRVNFEHGEIDANRPRSLTPEDRITQWFTGMNKFTVDPSIHSPLHNDYENNPWLKSIAMGRQYWPATVGYYGSAQGTASTNYMIALINNSDTGFGIDSNGVITSEPNINGLLWTRMFGIASYKEYNTNLGTPGSGYYATKSLTDDSVFDFYGNLIDGDNKREWQNWNAGNLAISQTFFDNRLGFEFVYDVQRYDDGQEGIFNGGAGAYAISVDINERLLDGSPNPNVGRAYVSGSTEAGGNSTDIDRDGLRFTLFGELRADDFLKKSWLTKVLGRHLFTGLMSRDIKQQHNTSYASSWANPDFAAQLGENPDLGAHIGAYNWVAYLGGDLRSASSASGANLSRIQTIIDPPATVPVRYFDQHWAAGGSVNPAAPYTYTDAEGVTHTDSTQSENPANYVGWTSYNASFRSVSRGDRSSLLTADSQVKNEVTSKGVTWQGYMFDGNFVPVFGWRRDTVKMRKGEDAKVAYGFVDGTGYTYDPKNDLSQSDESTSWGAVLHMPASLSKRLPGSTRVSIFYNRSSNFKADEPRQDVFGNMVDNARGKTKEYGFAVSTLEDKLNLKVTWYKTSVLNATLPYGTGFNYLHWAVPAWLVAHAAIYDATLAGGGWGDGWDYVGATGVTQDTLRAALADMKNFPLEQSFFNSYNNELPLINVAAVRAGNLQSAWPWQQLGADPQPGAASVSRVGTADTTSKGVEFELTAQPVQNWNMTINVSKTQAQYDAISPTITTYMDAMTKFLDGPAGDIRIWGEGGDSFRKVWADNVLTSYSTLLAYLGNSAPEIAPWRANLISTYSFNSGFIKGAYVGGGYRWEDKKILGYGLTNNVVDSSKPLYGSSEDHFDVWVGYSRKLTDKINWRIQLNVRNVGEDHHLVAASLQPDGTWALARIVEGMTWQLSNTFSF